MFFAALLALPVLAGVVAGAVTERRSAPAILAVLCVVLGLAGAIAIYLDAETTDRGSSTAFGIVAGLVCAGLVWLGFGAARFSRRGVR